MIPEDSRHLLLTEYNKSERILMCSNDTVSTRENPNDGASRGLNAARVHSGSCWFQGPPFLWQNENNWPGVKGVKWRYLRMTLN